MKVKDLLAIFALSSFLIVSCKQDPIFYIISTETAPMKPRIEGAPTNMVVFTREFDDPENPGQPTTEPVLFVASGQLHWYARGYTKDQDDTWHKNDKPRWDRGRSSYDRIPQPSGKIISLAVAGSRMYALCRNGNSISATLRYIESDGHEWIKVDSVNNDIQSIHADPESDRLFAGAGRNPYSILYLDTADNTLKTLKSGTEVFSGAVCKEGVYYLSTIGDGIFQITESDLAGGTIDAVQQLDDKSNISESNQRIKRIFMNIFKLEDGTILAVERSGGALYEINGDSFARVGYEHNDDWMSTGRYTTSALALWEDPLDESRKALVIGMQGGLYSTTTSSFTFGYVEFDLNTNGSLNKNQTRRNPGSLQTVDDQDRYTSSLGKHPINHLFQAPEAIDPDKTFFASTQTAGLWSYRDRPGNGGLQWNAEE